MPEVLLLSSKLIDELVKKLTQTYKLIFQGRKIRDAP
jgi:hypothetical protein